MWSREPKASPGTTATRDLGTDPLGKRENRVKVGGRTRTGFQLHPTPFGEGGPPARDRVTQDRHVAVNRCLFGVLGALLARRGGRIGPPTAMRSSATNR